MACNLADTLQAAIDQFEIDGALFNQIVQGDDQTTVQTDNGPVNSAAKAIRLFVDRTDWGGSYIEESTATPNNVFLQGSFIIDDARVGATNNIYIVELDFTSTTFAADITSGFIKLAIEIGPVVQLAIDAAAAAAVSEANAATSETNAATSAIDADDTLKEFETEYLGAKASDPVLDNEGNALITGALYFNTTIPEMRVFNGSVFVTATGDPPVVTEQSVVLTEGQTVITGLTTTDNAGVYVEGNRLSEIAGQFTIDSSSQITLAATYTAGSEVIVVARDFQGAPEGQGASAATVWNFDTATADADPGANTFRLNNATQSAATQMFVSKISKSTADVGNILLALQEGDYIFIQDQTNITKGHLIKVDSGGIIDATTYVKIPIIVEDSLIDLINNDETGHVIFKTGFPSSHASTHASGGSDELALAASQITSGTFADARIAASNVTQHVGSIDHNSLLNYLVGEHRIINDVGNSAIELLSSQKILDLVSSISAGIDIKDPVNTSTEGLGNITLSGEQTLNGVTTSNSRVGVLEQTAGEDNGYYDTASGAWTRTTDTDEDAEVTNGMATFVDDPASSVFKHRYLLTTSNPIIVGTTPLTFAVIPALEFGTTAGTATEGNDSRIPTQDENDALVGTNGAPSTANPYVTNSDPRLASSGQRVIFAFGASGNISAGVYFMNAIGIVMSSTIGYLPTQAGTVVEINYTRADTDAATIEVQADGVSIATLATSATSGNGVVSGAFTADQIISVINQAGGNAVSALSGYITIEF